jgi:DNA polymerase-3 subunit alpha
MFGGLLSSLKFSTTRDPKPGKPSKYVMFDLEDLAGTIRTIVWPEQFAEMGHLVAPDAILLVRGVIDRRGGEEANLVVNELVPLDQIEARYPPSGIVVRVSEREHGPDLLEKIREIVRSYSGNGELQLALVLEDGCRVFLRSHKVRLEVNRELLDRLDANGNGQRRNNGFRTRL